MSSVVIPFDQRKVYGPAGFTLRSIAPLLRSQVVEVTFVFVVGMTTLEVTENEDVAIHPPPSVTVTV